jgi:hypothetical protein
MAYDTTYNWDNFSDAGTYFDYHSSNGSSGEQVVDEPTSNGNAPDWQWTDESSPSGGTGPPGGEGCVYPETSSPASNGDECWAALKTAYEVDAAAYLLFVTASICTFGSAGGDIYLEAWNGASWDILAQWTGSGTTTFQSVGPYNCNAYTNSDFKVRFRVVIGGTSYQNDFAISQLRIYGDDAEGITSVDPTTFDFDNADIDINGLNFLAAQGSGEVYLSDADTLAGSANEVDITSAVNTWADILINLDLTQLSAGEIASLNTLGPGTRYIIVLNDDSDEYGSAALTVHRIEAFVISLSSEFAPGATTAQLTAPATKTTGDFDAGRIEEVDNPATAIDITDGNYTEIEFCFKATGGSREVQYDFRIVGLDTYTLTPQLTIAAAAGVALPIFSDEGIHSLIFGGQIMR